MTNDTGRGLHGQTVHEVARRILTGELPPGSTIAVAELETEMDVSRTAMREALKVLSAKGLVGARQKRGTFVRDRSEWNLLDADVIRWQFAGRSDESFLDNLHELRGIVEPASARLAALRRTDADIAALDAALTAMAEAGDDPASAVAADLDFHRALLSATHNELVERMEVLIETGLAARDRLVHGAHPHDDPVPSHSAVADAVRRGDPHTAELAMRWLLDKAKSDQQRTTREKT